MARENYSYSGSHCLVSQSRAIHIHHIVKKSCRKPHEGCFLRYPRYTAARIAAYISRIMKWSLLRSFVHRKIFTCEAVFTKLTSLRLGLVNQLGFTTKSEQVRIPYYETPSCHSSSLITCRWLRSWQSYGVAGSISQRAHYHIDLIYLLWEYSWEKFKEFCIRLIPTKFSTKNLHSPVGSMSCHSIMTMVGSTRSWK